MGLTLTTLEHSTHEPDADTVPLAFTPTEAWPGSWAKLEVMRQRFENGLPLHHPDDISLIESWREWHYLEGAVTVDEFDLRSAAGCTDAMESVIDAEFALAGDDD